MAYTFVYMYKYANEKLPARVEEGIEYEKKVNSIYKEKALIFKALSHPTRVWMVEKIKDKEACVCEFADAMDVDFSTISRHLSVLKNAGIIQDRKQGKQVFYSLRMPCVIRFLDCAEQKKIPSK